MGTKTIQDEDRSDSDADSFAGLADAACVAFARAESPRDSSPRSANSRRRGRDRLRASSANLPTNASFSDPAAEYAAARATVSGAYRESVARLLTTMTGRRGAGAPPLARRWATFPSRRGVAALAGSSLPRVLLSRCFAGGVFIPRRIRRGVDAARGRRSETRAVLTVGRPGDARRRVSSASKRVRVESRGANKPPSPVPVATFVAIGRRRTRSRRTGRRTTRRMRWRDVDGQMGDASRCTRRQR